MSKSGEKDPESLDSDGTVSLPRALKNKIKDGLLALSLANLCLIKVAFDLLSDQGRYFSKLPVTTATLLAWLTNLCGLALIVWLVMQLLRRFPHRLLHLAAHFLFLLLLLLPLDFIRMELFNITDYQIFKFLTQPVMIFAEVVLTLLFVWQHRLLVNMAAAVVAILTPLAIFAVGKVILVCLNLSPLAQCPDNLLPPPVHAVHAGQPRVVWIIFDELDYRVTFEKPAAGFQFPEFERLRQESLSASHATAPADVTIMSMPALILGRRLAEVASKDACGLTVTFADSGITSTWRGNPSVFSEARQLGFNTALVGWYVPYSRELGDVLNFCEWYPYPLFEPARSQTYTGELWQQLDSLTETVHLRRLFLQLNLAGMKAALPLVTNAVYGLTLLHLPAPHRPGIYLPEQDRFSAVAMSHMSKATAYFDNLVLADHELGKLRRAMEASGQWDQTWVIVSADHSWRESRIYDEVRDYRVPFLIKPPGASAGVNYDRAFNSVVTHDLILAVLHGDITNQQDTAVWLDHHGQAWPPVTGGKE